MNIQSLDIPQYLSLPAHELRAYFKTSKTYLLYLYVYREIYLYFLTVGFFDLGWSSIFRCIDLLNSFRLTVFRKKLSHHNGEQPRYEGNRRLIVLLCFENKQTNLPKVSFLLSPASDYEKAKALGGI
jgi:hypothetical protein